jgi:hypothetical protein
VSHDPDLSMIVAADCFFRVQWGAIIHLNAVSFSLKSWGERVHGTKPHVGGGRRGGGTSTFQERTQGDHPKRPMGREEGNPSHYDTRSHQDSRVASNARDGAVQTYATGKTLIAAL